MGVMAERNSWGKDEGCAVDVGHVRRLADAGGFWAVLPFQDAYLGRIRYEALQRFGCLVFYGEADDSHEEDVLVLLAYRQAGADFTAFVEDLVRRFKMPQIAIGEGRDARLIVQKGCRLFATWDGTEEGLAEIYRKVQDLIGFKLVGSYDTSVMRRFCESRRPTPGP